MASASAMVRPPQGRSPPRPPPPPPRKKQQKPPPPRKAPPPPPKRPPPPPPVSRAKRPAEDSTSNSSKVLRKSESSIRAVSLRDVTVFEKKEEVGKGTYGIVFVAQDIANKDVVALKQVNTKQEENGFPMTALREVKILKALNHENIVTLKEMVTSKGNGPVPKTVYMVFDYFEFDLFGILETPQIRFTADHIKSWSHQLLSGIHYSHKNKVIHRDLKTANLLVNKFGVLKIADWGLARSWNTEMKALTNPVITLWYRPPELLLAKGRVGYTSKIDMWSVGCIIAEMMRRSGFLRGTNDDTQLKMIFRTCGHPTEEDWPELTSRSYSNWKDYKPSSERPTFPNRLVSALTTGVHNPAWMTPCAVELLTKLLTLNPQKRWSADQALLANYFFNEPSLKDAKDLPMDFSVTSSHEMNTKARLEREHRQKHGIR